MEYICCLHCRSMERNYVEAIECTVEIWMNQTYLQEKLDLQIYLTKISVILRNLKNNEMRNTGVWKLSTL